MPVFKVSQQLFTQGELGPYMEGRFDNEIYKAGVQTLENYVVLPHGGIQRRRGFEFIDTLPASDQYRLVRFDFNNEQEYCLVFYNSNIRIYKDRVLQATVSAPYAAADLISLRFAQSGDTMIIVHKDYAPRKLVRGGNHTTWTLSTIAFDQLPFFRYNTAQTLTPSATTGSINLTLSGTSPADDYWTSDYIGARIEVNGGTATITSITNTLIAVATVNDTLSGTGASSAWREDAWGDHRGFPRTAHFFNNRLYFGGTRDATSTVFASDSADFFKFDDQDVLDDNAFAFTLSTDQVHTIVNMIGNRDLLIFTSMGEFLLSGGGSAITPTNVQVNPQSEFGSLDMPLVNVEGEIIFADYDGKEILAYLFEFASDQFKAKNYTLLNHHMFIDGQAPTDIAYMRSYKDTQANMVFVVREDGEMPTLFVQSDRNVLGWGRFTTDGTFRNAEVVRADNGNGVTRETLHCVVTRNGTSYLEVLTEDDVFVDHWYTGTATPKSLWTGLTTLSSESVQVVGDNVVQGTFTVNGSGELQLNEDVGTIYAGLAFTSTAETMPLTIEVNGQSMRGERMRKIQCFAQIDRSKALKIDTYDVAFRALGADLLDDPLPEFTGMKIVRLSGISTNPVVTFSVTDPLPSTLLGYVTELKTPTNG